MRAPGGEGVPANCANAGQPGDAASSRQVRPRHRIRCFRIPRVGRNFDRERIGTERFRVWGLRPGVQHCVTGSLERDSNPRHSASNRCSTRLSYPAVGGPDSNRRPHALHALSPTELPPSRRTLVRSSAYATAGPRAPDGMAIRTAANRRSILRIAVARRQSIASPLLPSPCRSIKARCASRAKLARDGPSLVRASSVVVAPVSACAGCFGAEAASLKLFPVVLCECFGAFGSEKKMPPGWEPEGIRVASGDRGGRSPCGEISLK